MLRCGQGVLLSRRWLRASPARDSRKPSGRYQLRIQPVTRQKLAKSNQIDVRLLVEPPPTLNEFAAEVSYVRDRAAE